MKLPSIKHHNIKGDKNITHKNSIFNPININPLHIDSTGKSTFTCTAVKKPSYASLASKLAGNKLPVKEEKPEQDQPANSAKSKGIQPLSSHGVNQPNSSPQREKKIFFVRKPKLQHKDSGISESEDSIFKTEASFQPKNSQVKIIPGDNIYHQAKNTAQHFTGIGNLKVLSAFSQAKSCIAYLSW